MIDEEKFAQYWNHEILSFERITIDADQLSSEHDKDLLETASKHHLNRIQRLEAPLGLYENAKDSGWPKAELIEHFEADRKKYIHFQMILSQVSDKEIFELWECSREALVVTMAIIKKSVFAPIKKLLASSLQARVQTLGLIIFNRIDRNQWNNEITNDYCETPRFKESIKRLNRKTINKALPQDSNLNIATPKTSPPKASAFIASKPKAELSSADIYIRAMLFIFLFSLLPAMIVQVLSFLF